MSGVTTGKILHTSDLHLRERGDRAWQSFLAILETARSENVDLLVVSGDLFDRNVDAEMLRPSVREHLSGNPFDVVILPGNHDHAAYQGGRYYGDDITLIENYEIPVESRGVHLWGIPFEPMGMDAVLYRIRRIGGLCSGRQRNILLFHGEAVDSFYTSADYGDEEGGRYMPVRLDHFGETPFDYVLAGHFHTRFDIRRYGKNGYFVYPGSPCAHTRKETGPRKVNLFTWGEPPCEHALPVPFYEKIDIRLDPLDIRHPLEAVREELEGAHDTSTVLLSVDGFFNGERFDITEEGLSTGIKALLTDRAEAEVSFTCRDVRDILEDELFGKFTERLKNRDVDGFTRERTYRTALRAMMRVTAEGRS
jgi:DNA repair exonuclease SbcCD nuclease subunit